MRAVSVKLKRQAKSVKVKKKNVCELYSDATVQLNHCNNRVSMQQVSMQSPPDTAAAPICVWTAMIQG